jgi:hypothetical protein
VKAGELFLYFDPLDQLSEAIRRRWAMREQQEIMVQSAIAKAREHIR